MALIQAKSDAVKRQLEQAGAAIDRQKAGNDLVSAGISRQISLIDAQSKVSATVGEARQAQLKAAVDRAGEAVEGFKKLQDKNLGANQKQVIQSQVNQLGGGANDPIALVRNKQAAEAEADREKLVNLQRVQAAEKQTEQLKLKQAEITARNNVLDAQRANITAKIAENEQRTALLKAEKTGDQNEIDNAKQALSLAQQNVEITGAQIGNAKQNAAAQSQVGQLGLQALDIKQSSDQKALQEENARNGRSRARELAETADAAGQKLAIDPAGGASQIGFGNDSLPSITPLQEAQALTPANNIQALGGTLSDAINQLGDRLSNSMSRPNLTVSSPQPINDAAKISADLSKSAVGDAGL